MQSQKKHIIKMKKNIYIYIITLLIIILPISVFAQKHLASTHKPTLVVSIIIDGMRYDYLDRWSGNFTDKGFKLFMQKGAVCTNAEYNYAFTQTATGMATISTGCEPSVHGIIADKWYKRINNKLIDAIYDPKILELGNSKSKSSYSPHRLQATTFSDEMKLFYQNKSKVISVSLEPKTAVMGGGLIANSAYWFNVKKGEFTTSSYYIKTLPSWVKDFNNKHLPNVYLQNQWQPLLSDESYKSTMFADTVNQQVMVSFANNQPKDRVYPCKRLMASPYGISVLKDFAISTIVNNNMGKDNIPDYLNITFTSLANINKNYGINSKELEDGYLRLDKELTHLIKFIEDFVGKQNVLFVLTSTHGATYNPNQLKKHNIRFGYFDGSRASTLVQTYLSAKFGKGKWVTAYDNKQIYLNRDLIEDSKLDLEDIQNQVALFFTQFTGVANAVTATTLERNFFSSGIFAYLQNSYNPKRSGDVLINLEPGWKEKNVAKTLANSGYKSDTHVPLLWYGANIKPQIVNRKVNMCDIAPTISLMLKTPVPNACSGSPIIELFK